MSVTTAANFNPSQAIHLEAFPTFGYMKNIDFASEETRDYFDANHVDLVGITRAQLIQNQALPEGNYTICVHALDYRAPYTPRSADACFNFQISYIDPPVLIQPSCGTSVPVTTPQFVLFTWTPPATAQGLINYEFTLKEVPNNLNPYDVIKMNIYPVLFNTTQTSNNTLVYGVDKPQLEEGKKYVWQVRATGDNMQFKNGGYSDACSFTWGTQTVLLMNTDGATIAPTNTLQAQPQIHLISPANNSTADIVKSSSSQGVPDHYQFEWKPAPVIGGMAQVFYKLRIAHIVPGQTVAQALKIDSQVIERTVPGTSFSHTKFTEFMAGEKYAWEVQYLQNGVVKYFSEQWIFQVKKTYGKYKINGTLNYSYALPAASFMTWNPGEGSGGGGFSLAGGSLQVTNSPGRNFPYVNKKINLYKAILIKEGNSSKVTYDASALLLLDKMLGGGGTSHFQDVGEFIGSTTTDEAGHFSINTDAILGNVFDTVSAGVVYHYVKTIKVSVSDGEDLLGNATNPYVNNPDEYILVDGSQTEISKTFNARVKSYRLGVTFNELPVKNYYNKPVTTTPHSTALTMYILRMPRYPLNKSNPKAFPHNEGLSSEATNESIEIGGHSYEVISKQNATTGVECQFSDLVISDMDMWNDRIFVYAKYANDSRQIMTPVKYKTGDWSSNIPNFNDYTFQPSNDWDKFYKSGCYDRKLTIVPDQLTSTSISGKLSAKWAKNLPDGYAPNTKQNRPVANTSVYLKAVFVLRKADGTEQLNPSLPSNLNIGNDATCYAVTQTDENGNFKFDFNVYSDSSTQSSQIGFIKHSGGGDLYRVLKVIVNNPYYYSPDNSFVVDGGYEYEVGELISNVREGVVTGRLTQDWTQQDKWTPIPNQRVKLCRLKSEQSWLMPKDEGDMNTVNDKIVIDPDGTEYIVLEEAYTKGGGYFSFSRMGFAESTFEPNVSGGLYLYCEPDEISSNNFKTTYPVPFPNTTASKVYGYFNQFNSQQPNELPYINYEYFEAKPLNPTIRGAIHPASNMGYSTLADAHVILYQYTDLGVKALGYVNDDAITHGVPFKDELAIYGTGGCENWFNLYKYDERLTTDNGRFIFENLPVKSWMGKPYHYLVYVQKSGFLDESRIAFGGTPSASPKKGQQETMMLDLRLPVKVRTKVVEQGTTQGVMAKIVVGDNYSWAQTKVENFQLDMTFDAKVQLECPVGKVKVYIYPENMDMYMPDSATIFVKWGDAQGYYDGIQQLSVRPRLHDIDIMVYDKNDQSVLPYMGAQLTNANVTAFQGGNCTYEGGKPEMLFNHVAHCTFKSNGTKFDFIVYGEKNGVAYVPKQISVNSDPQFYEGWNDVAVFLEPGLTLTGYVKTSKGEPVAGAHVYVEDKFVSTPIEATTGSDGSYTLSGVPRKSGLVISAGKPSSNMIGDWAMISTNFMQNAHYIKLTSATNYTRNFTVTECTTMDISSLEGFPMEVSYFVPDGNGGGKISGRIINLPDNDIVKNKAGTTMQFTSIDVKPGTSNGPSGKPKAVAKTLPVYTDEFSIPLKLYGNTLATLTGFFFTGVQIDHETTVLPAPNLYTQPQTSHRGVVNGVLFLNTNSFPKGAKFETQNLLAYPKGKTSTDFYTAFTSDKSKPFGQFGFRVSGFNKNPKFNLFNRYPGAEADVATSILLNDEYKMNTTVHTNLNYVDSPDIHLNVGEVRLTTGGGAWGETQGKSEIKIPLGKWSLSSSDWKCSEYEGLVLKNSTVNTGVSVPVKNMTITYTDLLYGDPQIDNLSLAGIVQLNLEPGTIKSFGFDKSINGGKGAWSFIMLPAEGKYHCAQFGDLPGMTGGTFKVASVRSYSNGYPNKIMLLSDNQPVTINQVANFSPGSMDAGSDNIKMQGQIDFGVPSLKYDDNFTINWIKKDGDIKTVFENPSAMSLNAKGIKCVFPASPDKYVFADGKLELTGTMEDENTSIKNYKFDVKLVRDLNGSTISTIGTANKFLYNASNTKKGIEKVDGNMTTNGGATWTNFNFQGDLFSVPAEKGIKDADKHVLMSIKGDVVAQPGNKIGVEGAETPFGNMNFVYDFEKGALVGSSHLETESGMQHLSMDVEMMMGSGSWYFFGAGKVSFPPDFWIHEASAATFVGRVNSFPASITNKFKEFSVTGALPPIIKTTGYTGLIAACGIKMPIPKVPSFDLSLDPFFSAGIDHEITANITTGLNFDGSPTFGFNVNGKVYLHVHAGASVGVGCVHADGHLSIPVDVNGCISIMPVAASLSGSAWLEFGVTGEVGIGTCDSDCEAPWWGYCGTVSKGFCLQASAGIYYNTNGPKGLEFGGINAHWSCPPLTPFPEINCGQ